MVIDRLQLYIFFLVTAGGTVGILLDAPHIFQYVDQDAIIEMHKGKASRWSPQTHTKGGRTADLLVDRERSSSLTNTKKLLLLQTNETFLKEEDEIFAQYRLALKMECRQAHCQRCDRRIFGAFLSLFLVSVFFSRRYYSLRKEFQRRRIEHRRLGTGYYWKKAVWICLFPLFWSNF